MVGDVGVGVEPDTLGDAATTLRGLARDLHAGQFELVLLDWAGDPASHPDVAEALRTFGRFAHDQYRDAVALLSALSAGVQAAGDAYAQTDDRAAFDMYRLLTESTFRPAT